MSPRTKAQNEQIREEKKALIMSTALQLFAQNGYHSTSMSQIAKSAGISKGLSYNYFESKEAILSDIIDWGFVKIFENFDLNQDGQLEVEELRIYLESMFASLKENVNFWKFYFQIAVQADAMDLIKQRVGNVMQGMIEMMVAYFKSQNYESPEIEAYVFVALMDGIAMDYVLQPDFLPIDAIKENIIKKYCGLKAAQ
jgi:AcrR family transcriptional regulator